MRVVAATILVVLFASSAQAQAISQEQRRQAHFAVRAAVIEWVFKNCQTKPSDNYHKRRADRALRRQPAFLAANARKLVRQKVRSEYPGKAAACKHMRTAFNEPLF